jgi:hypothetical protein
MFDDPCSRDDNVADMPNQRGPNSRNPTFPNFAQACEDTGPFTKKFSHMIGF